MFYCERRSELAGVILRENSSTRLVARDDVPLRKAAQLSRTPGALLKFGAPGGVEYAPPSTVIEGDALVLNAPDGVSDSQAQARRDRADARRAERDRRSAAERELRKERDAQRDAARQEERRRLLREKKARKQAEREARSAGRRGYYTDEKDGEDASAERGSRAARGAGQAPGSC